MNKTILTTRNLQANIMKKFIIAGTLLCALSAPIIVHAAPAADSAEAKLKTPPINAGELRLDGKIKAILDAGVWQVEVISWTSPRQITTNFPEPKSKTVKVAADAFIHPLGEADKVKLGDVKLGTRVAVIGKSAADGSVTTREVVLLEGYGTRSTIGTVTSNPTTSKLVGESRAAREQGNLPQAMALIEKAITAAQGARDLSGEALATQDKTLLLFDTEQIEDAGKSAARVEEIGRALGNPLFISMGLEGQASVLAGTGQLEQAIQKLEDADGISAGSEPAIHLSVLSSLAGLYLQGGDIKKGVATLQRVFPLEESLRRRDDATGTLLTLASLLTTRQPDDARKYLAQAAPRIPDSANEKSRASLYALSGRARFGLGDKTGARDDFESAAKIFEAAGDAKSAAALRAVPAQLEKRGKKPDIVPDANAVNEEID